MCTPPPPSLANKIKGLILMAGFSLGTRRRERGGQAGISAYDDPVNLCCRFKQAQPSAILNGARFEITSEYNEKCWSPLAF